MLIEHTLIGFVNKNVSLKNVNKLKISKISGITNERCAIHRHMLLINHYL
jgi:hypothetical protein